MRLLDKTRQDKADHPAKANFHVRFPFSSGEPLAEDKSEPAALLTPDLDAQPLPADPEIHERLNVQLSVP